MASPISLWRTGVVTVSILLGNGDGTFGMSSSPAMGGVPQFVAVGDFNGDGTPDLAVVMAATDLDLGSVSILLGRGDGTFRLGMSNSFATGETPVSAAVGDFNGDGIPDLATANYGGNTVSILVGKGDGTFTLKSSPATSLPLSVAVADFNGDGIPDLATANAGSSTVSILLGIGDGTFILKSSPGTGVEPSSVAVGDFDGDGIPDPAVWSYPSGTVSILLGIGDGTFILNSSPAVGGPLGSPSEPNLG
jgi:hypothetical protein